MGVCTAAAAGGFTRLSQSAGSRTKDFLTFYFSPFLHSLSEMKGCALSDFDFSNTATVTDSCRFRSRPAAFLSKQSQQCPLS